MDYDDDHPLRRYVLWWLDKSTVYKAIDAVLVLFTGGFWLLWLATEALLLWAEHDRMDWDEAHEHYDDIEPGEDYRERGEASEADETGVTEPTNAVESEESDEASGTEEKV